MAKYAGNQMEAEHNVSSDRLQIGESKNVSPSLTGMADPKKRWLPQRVLLCTATTAAVQ